MPLHLLSPKHSASIVATFVDVFPDSLLWWEPVGGTGILVGRKPGAASPIGQEWPGLENRSVRRRLSQEQVRKVVWLDRSALEEYAARGRIITNDNQMLQFSEMRSSHSRARSEESSKRNQAILEEAAGRPPFVLPANRLGFSGAHPGIGP